MLLVKIIFVGLNDLVTVTVAEATEQVEEVQLKYRFLLINCLQSLPLRRYCIFEDPKVRSGR